MGPSEIELAQSQFLQSGGVLQRALMSKYKSGELVPHSEYEAEAHPYPKMLHLSLGVREIERETETIKGKRLTWMDRREAFFEPVVTSKADERTVIADFACAKVLNLEIDPAWSLEHLRREISLAEEPEAAPVEPTPELTPNDDAAQIAALKKKLADLEALEEIEEMPMPPGANALATATPAPRKRNATPAALPVVAPDPLVA